MRERDRLQTGPDPLAARDHKIRYASRQTSEEQRGFAAECRIFETTDRRGFGGGERVCESSAAALAQGDTQADIQSQNKSTG